MVVALGALAPVPAAHALDGPTFIGALNAERATNGIPGTWTFSSELGTACEHHAHYRKLNPGEVHSETPGKPGYTTDGAEAANGMQSGGPLYFDGSDHTFSWDSPLHGVDLYTPIAGSAPAGAGESDGLSCFFHRDVTSPAGPLFASWPGNGNARVPWAAATDRELPYSPWTAVGITALAAGPAIAFYVEGFTTKAKSWRLTDPVGALKVRMADASTTAPDGSRFGWQGGWMLPEQPLRPNTPYTATVVWTDPKKGDHTQVVTFTTRATASPVAAERGAVPGPAGTPLPPDPPMLVSSLRIRDVSYARGRIRFTVRSHGLGSVAVTVRDGRATRKATLTKRTGAGVDRTRRYSAPCRPGRTCTLTAKLTGRNGWSTVSATRRG